MRFLKILRILALVLCYLMPYIAHALRLTMHQFYASVAGLLLVFAVCWLLIRNEAKKKDAPS